jgi:hypothetical protein
MTLTSTDVDFSADLDAARRLFRPDYDKDGRLSLEEYRAIADPTWPDRLRSNFWDTWSDFA